MYVCGEWCVVWFEFCKLTAAASVPKIDLTVSANSSYSKIRGREREKNEKNIDDRKERDRERKSSMEHE